MLTKTMQQHTLTNLQPKSPLKLSPIMKAFTKWVQVDPGDRILDMSCGNGGVLQYFSQRMDCEISAMASSVEQFRQVRGNLGNVNVMYAQPEDIPWKNNSFDVVMCNTTLVEMLHPEKILKEVYRVLRPGGQFVLAAPSYPTFLGPLVRSFENKAQSNFSPFLTKQEMLITLEAIKFKNISWQKERGWIGLAIGWKEPLSERVE